MTVTSPNVINRTQNPDLTWNFTVIHTRFTTVAYVTDTEYATVQRTFYATIEPGAIAVKPNGTGGYAVAGMKFLAPSSTLNPIESEVTLISKTNALLSTSTFSKTKLSAYYISAQNAVFITVSSLPSGLYILTTKKGNLKFTK